ncbi:MAG: GNAT family N-acetyltransferase [Muribaculaceae bacterium]|nr:GNAT family N-acetyltransferase [Muribaculaceae bacterium]
MQLNPFDTSRRSAIEDIYLEAFPPEERRPTDDLFGRAQRADGMLRLLVISDERGHTAGMLSYWQFDTFLYVEHFAIDSAMRGRNMGAQAMAEFIRTAGCPVVLEVERPGANEMADRRIAFYTRLGFAARTEIDYIQPPYAPGLPSVPLLLMAAGPGCGQLDIRSAADTILHNVYGA